MPGMAAYTNQEAYRSCLTVGSTYFAPSSCFMFIYEPLTGMSIRNLPGGKGRPTRKADILTAICEPIV
jgi:hypothetical protein